MYWALIASLWAGCGVFGQLLLYRADSLRGYSEIDRRVSLKAGRPVLHPVLGLTVLFVAFGPSALASAVKDYRRTRARKLAS